MRLFYSLVIFGVSLQIAAYLIMSFHVVPPNILDYPVALNSNWLDLSPITAMFAGAGSTIIMIAGFLLKQGTYAVYATLIWVVGLILGPIKDFFIAIPNTIVGIFGSLLDASNPTPTQTNPILTVIVFVVTFALFFFIVEIIAQRQFS